MAKETVIVIDQDKFPRYDCEMKWNDLVHDAENSRGGMRFAWIGDDEETKESHQPWEFKNSAVLHELKAPGITQGLAGLLLRNW